MYFIVDNARIILADPMPFEQFHVALTAETDPGQFAAALMEQRARRVADNDDVRVCAAWLRTTPSMRPGSPHSTTRSTSQRPRVDQKSTRVQEYFTTG